MFCSVHVYRTLPTFVSEGSMKMLMFMLYMCPYTSVCILLFLSKIVFEGNVHNITNMCNSIILDVLYKYSE